MVRKCSTTLEVGSIFGNDVFRLENIFCERRSGTLVAPWRTCRKTLPSPLLQIILRMPIDARSHFQILACPQYYRSIFFFLILKDEISRSCSVTQAKIKRRWKKKFTTTIIVFYLTIPYRPLSSSVFRLSWNPARHFMIDNISTTPEVGSIILGNDGLRARKYFLDGRRSGSW